ncbi:Adenylate cyclase type 10 [Dinochytrium kinnereticum]|nr:Adenylate cyclase type 10 [Dinochytrium kinnereticum]
MTRSLSTAEESDLAALTAGRLSIHIGLGVGSVFRIHVGTQGIRRECFLSGKALGEASMCLDLATKGEMCVPLESWNAILKAEPSMQNAVKGLKLRASVDGSSMVFDDKAATAMLRLWYDHPAPLNLSGPESFKQRKRLPGFAPSEGMELGPWFKDYINEATAHRLLASRGEAQPNLNTLRKLSVVFLKLEKFPTDDAEEGLRIAQSVMDIVLPPLRQFQGTMRQFNVDDKGATVLLVWGGAADVS